MGVMICWTIWIPESKNWFRTIQAQEAQSVGESKKTIFSKVVSCHTTFVIKSHLLEVQQLLLAASAVVPELAAAEAGAAVAAEAEAGSLEAAAGSPLLSAPLLSTRNVLFAKAFERL